MSRAALALAVLLGVVPAAWGDGAITIADGKATFTLRFEVEVEGKSSARAWEEFLDRALAYFDRDGDGSLTRAEAVRMFAFPLPGRRALTVDFDKLDADRDGKATRAELRSFCRRGGFTPIVLLTKPPTTDDQRLADVLMRHLDTDNDGKVSHAELKRTTHLLERFDSDEDEALDRAELLAFSAPGRPKSSSRVKPATATEDAVLRVSLDAKKQSVKIEGKAAEQLRLAAPATPGHVYRLDGPASSWLATFRATRSEPDMRAANGFLLAQFETALADRPALTRTDLDDPAISGLSQLFRFADRDGDARLTLSELKAYLDLIRAAAHSQTWVTVSERGRSLFDFLDADGDRRLSYPELVRGADRLKGMGQLPMVVPWQVQVSFDGPDVPSWGGVPLPAQRRPRLGERSLPTAPRWFQAMDRNRDGVLSSREFVGRPELFRRLDADGDGMITVEEAVRSGGN